MNTSKSFDSIEQLIIDANLRISKISIDKQNNLIVVTLNSGKFLYSSILNYKLLATASEDELKNYRLIAGGKGIHWPDLDEDLSLKGFLKEELKKLVGLNDKKPDGSGGSSNYAMAA